MVERMIQWLVWRMPRSLVEAATIRMWAHATSGPWSGTVAPEVTVDAALRRWAKRR